MFQVGKNPLEKDKKINPIEIRLTHDSTLAVGIGIYVVCA